MSGKDRELGRERSAPTGGTRRRAWPLLATLAFGALAVASASASAGSPATIYVANLGSSSITPVDLSTGRAAPSISMRGLLPVAVAVTPNGAKAYVVGVGSDMDGSPGSVIAIDTATGTLANPIKVGTSPQSIVILPDGKTAYVLDDIDAATTPPSTPATVTPIDLATGIAKPPIKVGTLPTQSVLSPNGKLLYVLDTSPSGDGKAVAITPVETATDTAGRPLKVAASKLAFAPNGKTAYALNPLLGVVPIETATGKPGKPIALLPALPTDLAVTPNGKTIEVLGTPDPSLERGSPTGANWTLTPIATATGKAGKPIELGANLGSSGGMVAIAPNGKTAYVLTSGSSTKSGLLIPVNLSSGLAGKPIAVGRNPVQLAISPSGAVVYVLDGGVYGGAGSQKNTAGAVVAVAAATGTVGKPISVGFAPAAFAFGSASFHSATAATAASAAKNLVATEAVRSGLVAAFAAAHHLTLAEVGGTAPGSVFYAYDSTTHSYWAAAFFFPPTRDSATMKISFQDAGGDGVFSRTATGAWRFLGDGAPLSCAEDHDLPNAVLKLWGIPARAPGCPPA